MQLTNISIKSRLVIIATVAIIALALMLLLMQYQARVLKNLADAGRLVAELNSDMLQLRRHEKDFLLRQELRYLERHQSTQLSLQQRLTQLQQLQLALRLDDSKSKQFASQVGLYVSEFAALVQAQQRIGLTVEDGLLGQMRQAAQQLEQQLAANPELMVSYLQLRRLEKDFLLRNDNQYLSAQQAHFATLQASGLSDSQALNQYQQSLSALDQAMAERGYSESQGNEGKMRREIQATETLLKQLSEELDLALAAASQQINRISVGIFAVILLLVIALVSLIARSIHRPIKQASADLARIRSDKDFTHRLSLQGRDEITGLGADMNAVLSDVQGLIQSVNQSVSTLDQVTVQLAAAAKTTNQVMRGQQSETDMVATAITEMGATIQEIAANTENTANTAETSNQNALIGQQQVSETVQHIQALASRLQQASSATAELERDSVSIGSVLDVIRAIAEQTNLLALNAAIEAARAGDQGRGFAVVADEVRTLAQRTQQSTTEIEGIIKNLQHKTKDIAKVMLACRDDGMQSAEQAGSASQLLQQITGDISRIMDMTTQIATAIEEQSSVAAEVNRNVVKIRDMSEDTLRSAEHNSGLSEQVASQARGLRAEVIKFRA
ncbi:putative methyl-accepting chemotaxis sensory transducer [Alishewanella agri BL06]|uniref:Putative methyl-accepting chemotaxis sensory transducer n=1 Tax=Alishewanella agri BL06 TaxID=1195246 RepID=I8UAP5_9ALTE|nr:methyl-accepting chemotaxis protein [Alishewanella agri]EIW89043.1 putative methyl-accepting chemotaxis sensory transducer [Alishewanella agri BL06]